MIEYAHVSGIARRALDAIVRAYPRPIAWRMLVDQVYEATPGGGPLWASGSVEVSLSRARGELQRYGWMIVRRGGMVYLRQTAQPGALANSGKAVDKKRPAPETAP